MPSRTVKQWYDLLIGLDHLSSHNAAALVLAELTAYDPKKMDALGRDIDQVANALSAFRMLPTTSHEDKEPWYAPLPSVVTILNLVPPADNGR